MADPVIRDVPASVPVDQVAFFQGLKSALDMVMGHARNTETERALRVKDLAALGIDLSTFLRGTSLKPTYQVGATPSGDTPDPPTNLVVTQGTFVHELTWTNPDDPKVWYLEVWAADNSQSRSNAVLEAIYTVVDGEQGKRGSYKHSGFDVTHEQTYWIRSVSFAGKHSTWEPSDAQGGYVVPGAESTQAAITRVLGILNGQITESELYQGLSDRIDLIDIADTGLVDRVGVLRDQVQTAGTGLLDRVDDLTTDTEGNAAAIVSEQNARVSGDSALATDLAAVTVRVGDTEAVVAAEQTARADGDTAIASDVTALDTRMGTAESAITTEQTTRANADTAQASRITDLETTVDDPATGVDASATAITALDTRITSNDGDISSHASQITQLQTDVGNNAAALVTEQNTRASADTALASDITTLTGTVSGNTGAIQTEATTRASADTANAQAIQTVQTTVDGHTTSIQTQSESIDGIQGKYAVKIDQNGYVSGFGLISTANDGTPTSEMIMLVENFKIVTPGKNPVVPFSVGTVGGVSTVGIDGNQVIDGTLLAGAIQTGQLTAAHLAAAQVFIGHTIQSSNYIQGVSGWKLDKDGNLELNGGSITIGPGSAGYGNFTDKPSSLSGINGTEGSKLALVADGATNDADIRHATNTTMIDGGKIYADYLSVLSAKTGDLTVDGDMSLINKFGRIMANKINYSDAAAGIFMGARGSEYPGQYGFNFGDANSYVKYMNGLMTVGGDIISTSNVKANNITKTWALSSTSRVALSATADESAAVKVLHLSYSGSGVQTNFKGVIMCSNTSGTSSTPVCMKVTIDGVERWRSEDVRLFDVQGSGTATTSQMPFPFNFKYKPAVTTVDFRVYMWTKNTIGGTRYAEDRGIAATENLTET